MPTPCDGDDAERRRLIGLGDRSFKKSYFPELRKRLDDLERFRALLDRAGEAMFVCDLADNTILDANEASRTRLGLTAGGRLDRLCPAMARAVGEDANRDFVGGVRRIALSCVPGETIPFEVSVTLRRFGDTRHALVVARDISAQVRAEESTRLAWEKYRDIYENAPVGIYRSTPGGRYLAANTRFAAMFGYTSSEELILAVTDISHQIWCEPEDRAAMVATLAARGEIRGYEAKNRRMDGEIIWTSRSMRVVRDAAGDVVCYDGFVSDITARKKAELTLIKAQSYIKNIIDSMPSVMVGVDPEGKVTHWNQAAERDTGLPADQARGRDIREVMPALAEQLAKVKAAVAGRAPMSAQKQAVQSQGQIRYQDVLVYPLVANGVEGAVIRVDDVTDRVRIEEMMLQSEKMFSLGGLAAGMAHEINNPLGGILQGLQNVVRRLSQDLPANLEIAREEGLDLAAMRRYLERREVLKFLDGIHESGERAAKIVRNMLDFSHRGETRKKPEDMAVILEKSVELASNDYDLKKRYDFKQIEIKREYTPNLPLVPCVADEIEQVLLNLLKNAAHALADLPEGAGRPRIVLRLIPEIDNIRIEVEDNGPGMEDRVRKRVFEPFFTTKEPGVGTGLGLSVSYFIITQNHGGSITVETEPGRGTTCVIRLPATEKP